jgi:hypothetical protein
MSEGTTVHLKIGFDQTTRQIVVSRGEPGVEIARSAVGDLFSYGVWNSLEVTASIHNSAGTVQMKVNGVEHLNATGLDTRNGGSGYINRVTISSGHGQNGARTYVDDLIIGDATGSPAVAPGDARVEYLVPIGVGSKTEFTPLSGTNWGNVEEQNAPNDADYNTSPETGATDLFAMSNLTGNGIIHAIQPIIRVRKDDVGYRKIRPALYKSDGTGNTPRLYGGLDQAVSDSFAYVKEIMTTSPDTGLAWTVDEITDLQYGYAVGGGSQFSTDAWIAAF